jgi:hypothetical protein
MNDRRDPVDNALDLLQSQEWSAEPFGRELETRMMQQPNPTHNIKRLGGASWPLVILAVFAVGGGTFAATGGVEKLKKWLLTVEIDGQVTEVEVDEGGQSTFTIETEDGGTATVHIDKSGSTPDEDMTKITVRQESDGEFAEDVEARVVRKACVRSDGRVPPMGEPLSPELLAAVDAAEPVHEWPDPMGGTAALYILPAVGAEGSQLLITHTDPEGEREFNPVAVTPFPVYGEGMETAVEMADDGTLTIKVTGPEEGQERELKLKLMTITTESMAGPDGSPCMHPTAPLKIPGADGKEITITLEPVEEDEEAEAY